MPPFVDRARTPDDDSEERDLEVEDADEVDASGPRDRRTSDVDVLFLTLRRRRGNVDGRPQP